MQQRLQKTSLFIYYACMLLTFICIICLMTDYYAMFIYGTSEMGDFYKEMQIFNKAYYSSFTVIIIASVLLQVTGILKKAINKVGLGYLIILTIYTIFTIVKYNKNLNILKSQYMSFDITAIKEITFSLTWFNALSTMGILTMVFAVILTVTAVLNTISKSKG